MSSSTPHWEHFEHDADMGVRGVGQTQAQAFEQAALALTAIVTELESVHGTHRIDVQCEAPEAELLFVDWLNTLIWEMSTHKLLFGRFEVDLVGSQLRARAWGEPVSPARHRPAVEIKGATYTALRVAREHGGWIAQTVVDV